MDSGPVAPPGHLPALRPPWLTRQHPDGPGLLAGPKLDDRRRISIDTTTIVNDGKGGRGLAPIPRLPGERTASIPYLCAMISHDSSKLKYQN
jgi:hypothetical protein